MAEASPETIQRVIENSEKGLSQIESSLPIIIETRRAVVEEIEKKKERNIILDLTLLALDSLLAENEVIYDISASLKALLKATDDYVKRYYMKSLNLYFWEACQLFVGKKGDEYGLLSRIERLTKEVHQSGCQYIARHIIDDVQEFRKKYADKKLRDITRHYDDPIKMYEKQRELNDINFFAKGTNQLMAICMEISVVSSYLLNLLVPVKNELQKIATTNECNFKRELNDAVFNKFNDKSLKDLIEKVLCNGQKELDECYIRYQNCCKVIDYFKEKNYQVSEEFEKMNSLIKLIMEISFLRCDLACSVWGYLNATSDMERSQNIRLIYITKQAALTHIYGYNEKTRPKSLWAKIKAIEEVCNETLNTDEVEESLKKLTSNLTEDMENSNIYVHYRYMQDFYIPARLEKYGKMVHCIELEETRKLIIVCNSLVKYLTNLLHCISEKQKKERKEQYDEWMKKMDSLASKTKNNKISNQNIESMRDFIGKLFGEIKKSDV